MPIKDEPVMKGIMCILVIMCILIMNGTVMFSCFDKTIFVYCFSKKFNVRPHVWKTEADPSIFIHLVCPLAAFHRNITHSPLCEAA